MRSIELDHINTIKSLLQTLNASHRLHALIVEGPAGWGKSTTIDEALNLAGVAGVHLGAYSTPLNLFNFLYENADKLVVIDDCAGLFNDQSSMAILKTATWAQSKGRNIKWGSTTSKASVDEFIFQGKLVIVCNSFPTTADAEAVKSRSFCYKFEISPTRAKTLLIEAARNRIWYPDIKTAISVAKFLCQKINENSPTQISYRTLQMGYELAEHNKSQWEHLLNGMISTTPEDPKKLLKKLARQGMKIKNQQQQFEKKTGLKRRTFFKYRKEMNLGK